MKPKHRNSKVKPALAEAQRELDEVKAGIESLEATLRENQKGGKKETKTLVKPSTGEHSNLGSGKVKGDKASSPRCPNPNPKGEEMAKAYCFVCKEKVEVLQPRQKKLKGGNTLTQGKCSKGHKVSVIGKK